MVDSPDFNKLKNKFDLGGIVDNLKSMINPSSGTPDVDPNDDLGVKIAAASKLVQEMAKNQQEHAKNLSKINELLNVIFVDVESLRQEVRGEDQQPTESEGTVNAKSDSTVVEEKVTQDKEKSDKLEKTTAE